MKTKKAVILSAFLLPLLVSMSAYAQRTYDATTVEKISGTVESVEKAIKGKGKSYGVHLQVRTSKDTLSVHLGPSWYIDKLDTKIEKGDKIEVRGSRVIIAGKPAIVAAEIKKGGSTIRLREENGRPLWAGQRMGRGK